MYSLDFGHVTHARTRARGAPRVCLLSIMRISPPLVYVSRRRHARCSAYLLAGSISPKTGRVCVCLVPVRICGACVRACVCVPGPYASIPKIIRSAILEYFQFHTIKLIKGCHIIDRRFPSHAHAHTPAHTAASGRCRSSSSSSSYIPAAAARSYPQRTHAPVSIRTTAGSHA